MKHLLIIAACIMAITGLYAQNIAPNPSFEQWSGGLPTGWYGIKSSIAQGDVLQDTLNTHTGSSAVQLVRELASHKRFTTQGLPVTQGETYTITFWVRGHGEIRTNIFDERPGASGYGTYNPYIVINSSTYAQYSQDVVCDNTSNNAEFIFSVHNTFPDLDHLQIDDISIVSSAGTPLLVINEFMASNNSTVTDEAGDYDDWLEIYNMDSNPVDVAGLLLIDDNVGIAWAFPTNNPTATTIQPAGHLLVWCDNELGEGPLHTDFVLDGDSDAIHLLMPDATTVISEIVWNFGANQGTDVDDVSYGRSPDGTNNWILFGPGHGSNPTPGTSNELPGLVSIYDIQGQQDDSPYAGQIVTTSGVITALMGDNIAYLQDGSGAWNGIMGYFPNNTLSVGDSIEVTASVVEYYEKTELSNPVTINVLASGCALPAEVQISTATLNTDESYEGVLVQVSNITVTDADYDVANELWQIDDNSGTAVVGSSGAYTYNPVNGDAITSIVGVVDFSYDEFRIEPRDDNDINFGTANPSLTVVSPNGGETWIRDNTYTISWNSIELDTCWINIQLLENEAIIADIVSSLNNTGSYQWFIPLTVPVGSNYKIQLSTTDGQATDTSNAVFTIADAGDPTEIVINEIMYNPPVDLGSDDFFEYVEIYNPLDIEMNLSGWEFSNAFNYTFEPGALIAATSYLVISKAPDSLIAHYGITNVVGPFTSGTINNSGETIVLSDNSGTIVDTVAYASTGDWPSAANGAGSSLELISPDLDNALASSWQASFVQYGTPGIVNSSQGVPEDHTIHEVQYTDDSSGDSPLVGQAVNVSGIVTAVFDEMFFHITLQLFLILQECLPEQIWLELHQYKYHSMDLYHPE